MTKVIEVVPIGNYGNQLIEIMVAEAIRAKVCPEAHLYMQTQPSGLRKDYSTPAPDRSGLPTFDLGQSNRFWESEAYRRFADSEEAKLRVNWYCQRVDFFREYQVRFRAELMQEPEDRFRRILDYENALLIHVRGGDILAGAGDGWYFPLPLNYYERIIDESGLTPIFFGQLNSFYSELLQKRFPAALYVECPNAMDSFWILNSARHLVLCLSTFSWTAAFLSNSIETLYFPVAGLFQDKRTREQAHFIHRLAPKTFFDDFGDYYLSMKSYSDVVSLFNAKPDFKRLSDAEIEALLVTMDA